MQQTSVKALAQRVLARNSACNSHATTHENACNKPCNTRADLLHGIPLAELRSLAVKDWHELEANPVLLEAFAEIVATRKMRELGKVPPSYTARTFCRGCNATVPIYPGVAEKVLGCPWCLNRAAGRPVPRVTPNLKQEKHHV